MATKYGIPVVSVPWLTRSIEAGNKLNTDDFLMMGKSKSDALKEGKISGIIFIDASQPDSFNIQFLIVTMFM